MDGNGRWAKKRLLPRTAGHAQGVKKAKELIVHIKECGIPYVSLYTFSKENWKRPRDEVDYLMQLIKVHFEKEFKFYKENQIKVVHIGDKSGLSKDILDIIGDVEEQTKEFEFTVLIALNYSGKYDITQAVNRVLSEKDLREKDVTEDMLSEHLLTSNYPDPDVIVRTSGEFRISNYFLWQAAYSEFFVIDKLWPDMTKEDVNQIIGDFNNRERRYGGIKQK